MLLDLVKGVRMINTKPDKLLLERFSFDIFLYWGSKLPYCADTLKINFFEFLKIIVLILSLIPYNTLC